MRVQIGAGFQAETDDMQTKLTEAALALALAKLLRTQSEVFTKHR